MYEHPRHPDLVELEGRLTRHLDHVLEAEQRAAAIAVRRAASLRDRLLDAEDREAQVVVWPRDGGPVEGRPQVGYDHVAVDTDDGTTLVPFQQILRVVIR